MKLTKKLVLEFLAQHQLMTIATYGKHPWIASVYYSFDNNLHLYFLSSSDTLHAKQITQNSSVAIAITDSHQKVSELKKGLQIYGLGKQISNINKIKHTLRLWKDTINVKDPQLTYENMIKKLIKGRMYQVRPIKIKFFNQELFDVEDGKEPVLELSNSVS